MHMPATLMIVRPDELEEFEAFQQSLHSELSPVGVLEEFTFRTLLRAAWNSRRFARLEADLFVNGIDPLLDESSARILDRISRHAARAQREYYRALAELRTLQTDRALRVRKLAETERTATPPVVCINTLTKQTHSEVTAKALDMAVSMIDLQTKGYVKAGLAAAAAGEAA
jgi:hypothetical protein